MGNITCKFFNIIMKLKNVGHLQPPIFYIINNCFPSYFITLSTPNKGVKKCFQFFKKKFIRIRKCGNKWTKLDTASDLITCILPMILRSLQDHESKRCLTSSSFFCNCASLCAGFQQKTLSLGCRKVH